MMKVASNESHAKSFQIKPATCTFYNIISIFKICFFNMMTRFYSSGLKKSNRKSEASLHVSHVWLLFGLPKLRTLGYQTEAFLRLSHPTVKPQSLYFRDMRD